MTEPESAREGAVHEQDEDPGPDAQAWRARTRDSLPSPGATIIDLTQRHRDRVAERWGKPIEEPPPDAPVDPEDGPQFRDVLNQFHLYRDPSPSIKAVWADLCEGGARVFDENGMFIAVLYWAPGILGHGLVWIFEIGKTVCARPGRMYGAAFVLLLLWIALAVAGLNPADPF